MSATPMPMKAASGTDAAMVRSKLPGDAPWTVVKSNDKKRARLEAMRVLLAQIDYPSKDHRLVGRPDPLIVGPAARVHEDGEDLGRFFSPLAADSRW